VGRYAEPADLSAVAKGNLMTDQDSWRQQVERQLADLPDRVDRLSRARIGSRRISRRSTDALMDHAGLRPLKNPHGTHLGAIRYMPIGH
jgi:hypothetical protein